MLSLPVVIQAIMGIAILIGTAVAVVGQVRWKQVQIWEGLASARLQQVTDLERQLAAMQKRVEGLEVQVAELKDLNLTLQRRLDAALRRTRKLKNEP